MSKLTSEEGMFLFGVWLGVMVSVMVAVILTEGPNARHDIGWHQIACITRSSDPLPHCTTGEELDQWLRRAGR